MMSAQKRARLVAMALSTAGEEATAYAVMAVRARPRHIHPYTARRNGATRLAAASAASAGDGAEEVRSGWVMRTPGNWSAWMLAELAPDARLRAHQST